jgi:GNAT superfamily N-acetyltransferase
VRLSAPDVEAIERATLAAVAPMELVEDDGWLLAANEGAIGRANSVTALGPGRDPLDTKIDRAASFYEARGLPPKFRLSPWSRPAGVAQALAALDYAPERETIVMTRDAAGFLEGFEGVAAGRLTDQPSETWRALFVGPGVEGREAELRAASLARGLGMQFAEIIENEEVVAIGTSNLALPWAGVHGMRTAPAHRRRGYARNLLRALVAFASAEGARRIFLQVEADNSPAIALYESLGFEEAYRYSYWRPSR